MAQTAQYASIYYNKVENHQAKDYHVYSKRL